VLRILVVALAVALLAAGWDFSRFVARADHAATPDPPQEAQAVAVLTGLPSNARIVTAVQLADSLQLPLLISGVHVDTSAADIAQISGVAVGDIECCVTLGRAAATTEGNGAEVSDWARKNNVTRIILVTSEFHMDRALVELRRAMPEGRFIPHAVTTAEVRPRDWYRDPPTARRLLEEWMKFRIAAFRAAQEAPDGAAAGAQGGAG
jgi:uncharacterized SAM-binding protein YcdF (DUF218 family)